MSKVIDRIGDKYGMLTVISRAANTKGNKAQWNVQCDCGKTKVVRAELLQSGKTKSCGICLHTKHNLSRSSTYNSWHMMRQRCGSERPGYKEIRYDPRWSEFQTFLDDMGERAEGTSLSRIADTGDYVMGNVIWGDHEHQLKQKRIKHGIRS